MLSCKNWEFCDLSISTKYDLKKLGIIEKYGFKTIAINTYVEEVSDEPKKKKKKGESRENKDYIPQPLEIPTGIKTTTNLNILQRVTIEFSDSSIAHKLNQSINLKQFDIVAVVPKTLQAFQYACGNLDVDIITFEPENKIPFKLNRKLYRQAVERGIFFELMYSPMIKDSSSRKNMISLAHTYHAIGKSKNIIITSNAENEMQVCDIHDVINLGFILGLNHNESLEVVRNNTRRLIVKAEGRKCGKFYVSVSSTEENTDNKTL